MSSAPAEDNGEDTFDEGDDEWDQYTATRVTDGTTAQTAATAGTATVTLDTTPGTDTQTGARSNEGSQTVYISQSNGQQVTITAAPDSPSTPTRDSTGSGQSSKDGLSSGEQSGIIVACLLLLLLIAAAAWFFRARRSRKRRQDDSRQMEEIVNHHEAKEDDARPEARLTGQNDGEEYPAELLGYVKKFEVDGQPVSELEGDNSRYKSYIPYRVGIARKPLP